MPLPLHLLLIALLPTGCSPGQTDTESDGAIDTDVRPRDTDLDSDTDEDTQEPGESLYVEHCARCHALNGGGGGLGPEVQTSARADSIEALVQVMLEGQGEMEPVEITMNQAETIARWMKLNL